ncbi:MAG TPA: hypothetical protein VMT70_08315 [Vicinamibacteria bacterium]|nr:hypothetical protein [Vicinamibacteria bacterium]
MPRRAGITARPQERRAEWVREHPTMRNWQLFGPFASLEQAQAWESMQRTCLRSDGDVETESAGARWWGYWFDY